MPAGERVGTAVARSSEALAAAREARDRAEEAYAVARGARECSRRTGDRLARLDRAAAGRAREAEEAVWELEGRLARVEAAQGRADVERAARAGSAARTSFAASVAAMAGVFLALALPDGWDLLAAVASLACCAVLAWGAAIGEGL